MASKSISNTNRLAHGQTLTRREFMAATASVCAAAARPAEGQRRPNLLFIFSDEHRWQSMGHTELPQVRTPNMTALAEQGIEFTHCISNYPVCSPYRAILMSGKWPCRQGVIDNNIPLDANQPTFGATFRDAGYATCYIGKWHLGGTRGEPFGWDHSLIWTGDSNHRRATYHPQDSDPITLDGYTVDNKTDQLLAFITRHAGTPFCAAVSYNVPHADFRDAPSELQALYPPGSLPWRPNADPGKSRSDVAAFRFDEEDYTGYHAHITGMDRALGRIMAALDDLGIAEDTILVYTSDHGSQFGSHGVGSKRQPYDESIRVPFMCRWPRVISAGTKTSALFGTIDLLPTLCTLAGVPVSTSWDGRDFSPWFRGGHGPEPESQFIMHIAKDNASRGNEHPAPIFRGVRTKTHTYAVIDDGTELLFDNEADPYQVTNLAGTPESADIRAACGRMTLDWLEYANEPAKSIEHWRGLLERVS